MSESRDTVEARLERLSPRQRELLERILAERSGRADRIPPRPAGKDHAPPSFGQERIWFMDRLIPYRTAFCVPSAVRLQGPLDPAALHWALNQVATRHEVLRTVLLEEDGIPVQVILPSLE